MNSMGRSASGRLCLAALRLAAIAALIVIAAVAPPAAAAENSTAAPAAAPAGNIGPSYFVAEANRPVGPLTLEQVMRRIQDQHLGPATLVWKSGTPSWVRADQIVELAAAFGAAPAANGERFRKLLVGAWETQEPNLETGVWYSYYEYASDGTFWGEDNFETDRGEQDSQYSDGRWSVVPSGADRFTLTLTIEGQDTIVRTIRVVDDDTLQFEDSGIEAVRVER